MKDRLKLASILPVLPEAIRNLIAEHVPNADEAVVARKRVVSGADEKGQIAEGENAIVQYVSTRDIDRDQEILVPEGAILDEFKLAPQVLWGHDYSQPPIGKDEWIKSDGYGLKAKTIYAVDASPLAKEVYELRKGGFLNTASVGFVPIESVEKDGPGWAEVTSRLAEKWEVNPKKHFSEVRRIFTKWLLLEHSDVSVPANIHALTLAVGKGLALSDKMRTELGLDEPEAKPDPPTPAPRVIQRAPIVRHVPVVIRTEAPLDVSAVVADEIARFLGRV